MSNTFVPLAAYFRPSTPKAACEPPPIVPAECDEAIRAARRFRAGLSDAIDAALPGLLRTIARDVLARELLLAPAEIATVAAAVVERFGAEEVVCVRAHPAELHALRDFKLKCVGDAALQPGDIRIELRSGTIESTVDARLDALLSAWQ